MVGVVMKMLPGGVMISKIRTVHARSDFDSLITKDSILYLSENKKETKKWFEARGQHVPTGETQFGLIGRISYSFENVNINDINDSEKLFHSYGDDINKTIDKWSREAKARAGRSTATGTEVGKAIIPKEK